VERADGIEQWRDDVRGKLLGRRSDQPRLVAEQQLASGVRSMGSEVVAALQRNDEFALLARPRRGSVPRNP
jgi:hypothetical protein